MRWAGSKQWLECRVSEIAQQLKCRRACKFLKVWWRDIVCLVSRTGRDGTLMTRRIDRHTLDSRLLVLSHTWLIRYQHCRGPASSVCIACRNAKPVDVFVLGIFQAAMEIELNVIKVCRYSRRATAEIHTPTGSQTPFESRSVKGLHGNLSQVVSSEVNVWSATSTQSGDGRGPRAVPRANQIWI
jgi:hypothetical protein